MERGRSAHSEDRNAPIAVVVGTRPEIIKLAPVIARLGERALVVHSRQHWDHELAGAFFDGAGLSAPDVVLDGIGGQPRSRQIGAMTIQLGDLFEQRTPSAVVVQGDTNTTSAAAQAANYCGIPVVHVEAGLRSYDRNMPEELNRQVVGVLADLHCVATGHNADNLLREGISADRIVLTGNTIVEATLTALRYARAPARSGAAGTAIESLSSVLVPSLPVRGPFVLATIHRPENTDDPGRLADILRELGALDVPVVLALHPRTRARIETFGLSSLLAPLVIIRPVNHVEFLDLADRSALLVSDSGGVQEECTVLKKPLIVVRNSTERPEAIDAGFAHLVQPGPEIGALARKLLDDRGLPARLQATASPYGDRTAAQQIIDATGRLISSQLVGRTDLKPTERHAVIVS